MKKKRGLKAVLIVAAVCLIALTLAGLLLRDDGSLSGFVSAEARAEFVQVYAEAMAELPAYTQEYRLETDFGTVQVYYFVQAGTEAQIPLLLLPGKSAPTPMWEANLADLMAERPVYTLDLLGEPGLSQETQRIATEEDQARWLQQVISQLPEPQLDVMGLSFGGWNAVNVSLHYPAKIRALVLVDPVHVFAPLPLKMVLASIPASIPLVPQPLRESMLSYISGGADVDESVLTARLIETSMRTFKSKLPAPPQIKPEQLSSLQMPILGIIAANSTIHNAEKALACGETYLSNPHSKMVLFEGASHAINGEFPEQLAAAVAAFLDGLEED